MRSITPRTRERYASKRFLSSSRYEQRLPFSHPSVDESHSAQCPPCLKPIQFIPAIQPRSDSPVSVKQTLHFPSPSSSHARLPNSPDFPSLPCCPLHPLNAKYQMQPRRKQTVCSRDSQTKCKSCAQGD
jgi:hypothetical protein